MVWVGVADWELTVGLVPDHSEDAGEAEPVQEEALVEVQERVVDWVGVIFREVAVRLTVGTGVEFPNGKSMNRIFEKPFITPSNSSSICSWPPALARVVKG